MEDFTNLDPNNLVVFYFVVTEKSLTSAAEKLHLTQPAITYHIKSLEEYTRVKLIEFKKHQVMLTPSGKELFKYAEEIYHQLSSADRFIKSIRESYLRVGIASIFIATVSPVLTKMFEEQLSDIRLMIESGNAFELVQSVLDSKLDLALVPEFNYSNKRLKRIKVSEPMPLLCFTSADQPIQKQPLDWRDLLNYPLVGGSETSVVRKMLTDKFQYEGLEMPALAAEVGSTEWCKTLVENGKGLSFTLIADIAPQIKGGQLKLVELKDNLFLSADVVIRADAFMNSNMNRFINLVIDAFKKTNPDIEKEKLISNGFPK
jgi:LysR family transcriptional regulator, transcriptional activator of the cysJI operon